MPPRLPSTTTCLWRQVADSVSSSPSPSFPSSLLAASLASSSPIPSRLAPAKAQPGRRAFSSTPVVASRKIRRAMRAFLQGKGSDLKQPRGTHDRPHYQYVFNKAGPFPLNPHFKSPPVLSERARELVWEKVMVQGEPVKAVSAELGIDVRRIAAVIRLRAVENQWVEDKIPLARTYAKAMLSMLPQTDYPHDRSPQPHEAINEVTVHPYTQQQIFQPVAESQKFTRLHAAKAFHRHLLPADRRVPHMELVQMEREIAVGGAAPVEAAQRFRAAVAETERVLGEKVAKEAREEERRTTTVPQRRAVFRFKDYDADDVGRKGRSPNGVGWRYGAPFNDRRAGEIKIPTKVE